MLVMVEVSPPLGAQDHWPMATNAYITSNVFWLWITYDFSVCFSTMRFSTQSLKTPVFVFCKNQKRWYNLSVGLLMQRNLYAIYTITDAFFTPDNASLFA